MTEVKYNTHVYDLSIKRVDVPVDLSGGSINVIAVKGDCFIKINDKSQDPINLLHTANIKTKFTKFYLSNNVQVGGYVAIIVGKHCEFEITTNIARSIHEPLLLPPQNIPRHLLDRVIDTPEIINVWNIENAVLRYSFNTTAQDTDPAGLFFKPDGLKLYTIGRNHNNVNEYDLSTAWDISTTIFRHSFSISLQTTQPFNLFFSSDGAFMYVVDIANKSIFLYNLSTKWNVTTATHLFTFTDTPQTSIPSSVVFNPEGYKMYITSIDMHYIIEYDLSIAWDMQTATFKHSFDMSHMIIQPQSVFFSPDGLVFYVIGGNPNKVLAYKLLEAWNVTTAIYIQSFDPKLIIQNQMGLFFKPDGSKMYMICEVTDNIYEFDL